jgi:hypothetical protein
MINLSPPICLCGFTEKGNMVLGGAFQMADTLGIPLSFSLDQAEEHDCFISIPHYFASAIEHGWDDIQIFSKIYEALQDRGHTKDFEKIRLGCIAMFMDVAKTMPEKPPSEMGKQMKELIESDKLAHKVMEKVVT